MDAHLHRVLDMALKDDEVRRHLCSLVLGLTEQNLTGEWSEEYDDWECHLADRMQVIITGVSA